MSKKFTVTAENNPKRFHDFAFAGEAKTYRFDFSPWADDNTDVSSVTVTAKAGTATIGSVTLSANVASFLVTTTQVSGVLLEVKAETGTEIYIAYLDIIVKDPQTQYDDDYGMR